MAFSTANVGFGHRAVAFQAGCLDNDLPADEGEGSLDGGGQGHVLASVRLQDSWNGTGVA
jgi:hypothetical protein